MVDVIVASSYGYQLGALRKWAMDVEDPLSIAINDFPKRGILVRDTLLYLHIPSLFASNCIRGVLCQRGHGILSVESLTTAGGK
jgi:hypothetical protein